MCQWLGCVKTGDAVGAASGLGRELGTESYIIGELEINWVGLKACTTFWGPERQWG